MALLSPRPAREPGRHGRLAPTAVSRRSGVGPRNRGPCRGGGAAPGRTAIHRKPGEAAAVCAACRRPSAPAGAPVYASAPRPAYPPTAPATSPTAWTPHALPLTDVPASSALGAHLDHQTSLVTSPPRTGTALSAPSTGVEAGFRAGLGAPGRGTSSTTQLPTTIHSFHSFIHSGKNPTNGVNTGSIRQPGPQLWITAPVNAFSSTAWQVPERNGLSH